MSEKKKDEDKLPGQDALEETKVPAISTKFLKTRILLNKTKLKIASVAKDADDTATDVLKVGAGLALVFTGSGVVLPLGRLVLLGGGGKVVTHYYRKWGEKKKAKISKRIALMEDFAEYKKNRQVTEEAAPTMSAG